MSVDIGTKLGPYEITDRAGAGGMGVVFRARDTRLDRDVAIKFLSDKRSADSNAHLRFEREAKTISKLQHSNVCTLYDVGSHEGTPYLVMEYLEGQTLEERLAEGPCTVSEALRIGAQLAEGIDAAHRHGLVHRDLKPANVMLTSGGCKILDFGLARDGAPSPGDAVDRAAPTRTEITEEGAVVGTLPYMAPEQVAGSGVDSRADIWALGCIVYELVAGQRAFPASERTELTAQVLEASPSPLRQLRASAPARLDWVVSRCLEKDPERRWQSARDVALELQYLGEESSELESHPPHPRRGVWAAGVAAAVLFLTGVAAREWSGRGNSSQLPDVKLSVPLPLGEELSAPPAISSDGQLVAIATRSPEGRGRLYVRDLGSFELEPLVERGSIRYPFFSPDGAWIGFFADRKLWKVAVAGGAPVYLAEAPNGMGGSWGSDGFVVFSPAIGGELLRVSENGGPSSPFTKLGRRGEQSEYAHVHPRHLPDGGVLFEAWGPFDLVQVSSAGDEIQRMPEWVFARYSESGHLLRWDWGSGAQVATWLPNTGGVPESVLPFLPSLFVDPEDAVPYLSISSTGTIAFSAASQTHYDLAWVGLDGSIELIGSGEGYDSYPSHSGGGRVVFKKFTELWTFDLDSGARTPLVSGDSNYHPRWTPGGEAVVFASNATGDFDLYRVVADGTSTRELLLDRPGFQFPESFSPKGVLLFTERLTGGSDEDIWVLPPEGDPVPFVATRSNETAPRFSPDGRFVVYVSDESGSMQVYVVPFDLDGPKQVVSLEGGIQPEWSPDGTKLFYRQGDEMMVAEVRIDPQLRVESRRRLFNARPFAWEFDRYDVAPDGERLLMVYRPPEAIADRVDILLDGFGAIRALEASN